MANPALDTQPTTGLLVKVASEDASLDISEPEAPPTTPRVHADAAAERPLDRLVDLTVPGTLLDEDHWP
jgi:hypothetical protein